jgi:chromosome segregation ATPase
MDFSQKIGFIQNRINEILAEREQLKSQAENWKQLYAETTEVQKKLINQSSESAKQADQLRLEVSELRTLVFEHSKNIELEEAKNAELQLRIAKMQGLEDELTKTRAQLAEANSSLPALKNMLADIEQQLSASQNLNGELQLELQESRIKFAEGQDAASKVEMLNSQLAEIIEQHRVEVSGLYSRISELEASRASGLSEKDEIAGIIAGLEETVKQKQHALETLNGQIEDLQYHLSNNPLKETNDYLNSRVAQLEAEIENLKFERQKMQESALLEASQENTVEETAAIPEPVSQSQGMGDERYELLYKELQSSQASHSALENQISAYMKIIVENGLTVDAAPEGGIKNNGEQKKILKLAEAIDENSVESNIELKAKLNEMIKEIDRCIAKLSS